MNPEQSFYGYEDWHLPSPTSTPHNNRFESFPLGSPGQGPFASTPQLAPAWFASPEQPKPQGHGFESSRSGQQNPPLNESSGMKRGKEVASGHHRGNSPTKAKSARGFNNNEQASFPSSSFIHRMGDATLDDAADGSQESSQMQTPPPTRDASSRKKAQPRDLPLTTPSTIHSRRSAGQNESWLKRNSVSGVPQPSPSQFSGLDFTSPDRLFSNLGPMTAPAQSHPGLFWDPNSNGHGAFTSMSTIDEDPFLSSSIMSSQPELLASRTILKSNAPSRPDAIAARPQSARPTLSGRPRPQSAIISSSQLSFAGVDPSMLSLPPDQPNPLVRSRSFSSKPTEGSQPYQFHFDEMRREKERQRAHRAARRSFQAGPIDAAPFTTPEGGLRRSLTDARSRMSRLSMSSADMEGITTGLDDARLMRSSSPLKRHKSMRQTPSRVGSATRMRRSVVLTVDDKGTARTEVKVVAPQESEDSDSSDDLMLPSGSRRPGGASSDASGGLDAQTALRDVIRTRSRRQGSHSSSNSTRDSASVLQGPTAVPRSSHNLSASRHSVNWDISPTEADVSPVLPSNKQFFQPVNGFRCVCHGASDSGQPMIQCASCFHVLHMRCCGLDPLAPPHGFICPFCNNSNNNAPATSQGFLQAPFPAEPQFSNFF